MKKQMLVVVLVLTLGALTVTPAVGWSRLGDERRGIRPAGPTPAAAADEGADADGPAYADEVISDDLIVDGSACVGLDCVDGEVFEFDTLRLKENNLRIAAVDTSTSASFPTQDWQLVFNDSNNGGLNRFSIEAVNSAILATPLTIEAGDNHDAIYVDDLGRVGLGTDNPAADLHLIGADTPFMRLDQVAGGGFAAQTWDIGGNESNFIVRDAGAATLPFRIRPGAATSSLDITTDGVGVGTGAPRAQLDVNGDIAMADLVQPAAPSPGTMYFDGNTFCGWDGTAWRSLQVGGDQTCD